MFDTLSIERNVVFQKRVNSVAYLRLSKPKSKQDVVAELKLMIKDEVTDPLELKMLNDDLVKVRTQVALKILLPDDSDSDDVGLMPLLDEADIRKPQRKKRVLAHESLYPDALPAADMYKRSLMHRDTVNFVAVMPVTDSMQLRPRQSASQVL
ncbi:hypothetical protein BCR33DRAFT_828636 [Rhizoclosmatium globosum]|uniref:Uncharacterized protein n=1 Tax=Rhizoclosmatium globosum TaxID=329046 RepID=A0A1Y2BZJ2_9FUNG|nr:hypothetical protein BCR33DRAFT_828636 [Rhizoclosmatium globosum]|eukprot:ORY40202.1 hypothetical protein BCR33DRAFT_828636 [Rhizoclosmatium globosum]